MTTKDKIIDVETIDYVLNNMEYDWSEIEEELKEAIGLTSKFQNQKIIEEILRLLKLKIVCRTRGLTLDIHNQESKDFYIGARKELEEFYRHIADLDLKYLIADIECAKKYLDTEEIKEFEELLKTLGEKDVRTKN